MQKAWPINQLLILVTSISILFVIMKYAADVLAPFLISVSIAIILAPLLNILQRKHIPMIVSLFVIIMLSAIPIIMFGGYIAKEATEFANNFHTLTVQFDNTLAKLVLSLQNMGITVNQTEIEATLAKSNVSGIIKNLASQTSTQFSNIFLILFTVAFMLMESQYMHSKVEKILSKSKIELEDGMQIISKINTYFIIKVKTSLITSIWVLAVLWFYDINYFYLWAALAFFLNFIPVVGSIFAAVPPIILAVMEQGTMTATWVALWYVTINMVIGNILEPRIMGKGLGLSALVIFLSMTLWGWVLGPTGMILSVPLTMAMQFLFAQYKETEWIALILSDYGENITIKEIKNGKNDHA
jgi:predicted PurR-regulated permease PerM